MIPIPLIILGISATTLGMRRLMKNNHHGGAKNNNRNALESWCLSQGLDLKSENGLDINAHLPNGNPLIIEALVQGQDEIFKSLIAQNADVNAMNSEGKTALFYCNNASNVKKLMKAGADVNARDLRGRTAIFDCRDIQAAQELLKNGANLLIRDVTGKTVLHTLSTEKGDLYISLSLTEEYVKHAPMLLNVVDIKSEKAGIAEIFLKESQSITSFIYEDRALLNLSPDKLLKKAILYGKADLVKHALELGAKPSEYALITTVYNNNPHLIPLLVQNGVDINKKTEDVTVLDRAIATNLPECVRVLLDCGVRVTDISITLANYNQHPKILSMIHKTDMIPSCINIPDNIDLRVCFKSILNKFLIRALNANDVNNVCRLLKAGANPNLRVDSMQLLELEVTRNAPEMIQALLDGGADINVNGSSKALSMAAEKHYDECVELLLEHGACLKKSEIHELENNTCARIREIWKKYQRNGGMYQKYGFKNFMI